MKSRHSFTTLLLFVLSSTAFLTRPAFGQDVNRVRQVRLQNEDGRTVLVIDGVRPVNFSAFAVESPPGVVLELAATRFDDTAAPAGVEDWTVSSYVLANQGTAASPKARVTVFLARKAAYRVESSGGVVRLVLTPQQAPPPSTEQAVAQLERLRRQAEEMEKRIAEARAQAERLQRESEQARKDGKNARQDSEKLNREKQAAQQELAQLAARRDAILGEVKALQARLAQAVKEEENARQRLAQLEERAREVQRRQEEGKAELEKTSRQLQEELARRKAIEAEIRKAKAEIEQLRVEGKKRNSDVQQQKQLQEKLTKLEAELTRSQRQLKESQDSVQALEERRGKLQQQVAAEEEKLKTLRANAELENRKLNAELGELREQARALQKEKEQLQQENRELAARREALRAAVENEKKLQEALEETRRKNEELQRKAVRLAEQEQEKAREIENRRRSMESLLAREKAELAQIRENKQREQESLEKLKAARAEHQRLLTEEEKKRQELEKAGRRDELKQLAMRQKEREERIAQLEKQAAVWEKNARDGEAKAKALGERLEHARRELEDARAQYDAASRELVQVTQARDELRGQLREMKGQLEGIARQKAAQQKQLEELSARLAAGERKLRETERKLEENRQALARLEREQAVKERQVRELTASAQALAEKVRQDREALQEMDVRKARIQNELSTLEARRRELETAVQKTASRAPDAREVERRTAELKELESRRAKLEKDLSALEEAREALRRMEMEKIRAQEELGELERRKLEVSRQLDAMNRQKTGKAASRKEIEAREAEIRKLQQRREELEKELARLAERKVQLQATAPVPSAPAQPSTPPVEQPHAEKPAAVAVVESVEFKDSPWSHHVVLKFSAQPGKETISKDSTTWKIAFPGSFRPELRRNTDTSSYHGPIERVLTYNHAGLQAVVEIRTNGPREVQVRRNGSTVLILAPKTVAEVRRFQQTQTSAAEVGGYTDSNRTTAANLPAASEGKPASRKNVRPAAGSRGGYSGRFVDLDFKDADLHNVIRLVAEVWGKNVVIPDEIKGTITVKLTNVRVDRAFDVILKSKNLDWVDEGGNIIRIATLEQLTKEREDQLARTKTEVKMIPTETRLIPINYANVEDIAKTLEANVMSSRGKVSFDKRTNVIIYVDVPAKIKVAQELVRSLDLPTPQVQIEARIVEAETTFLREIGVQWGGSLLANAASGNPTGLIFPSNIGLAGGNMDQLTKTSGLDAAGAANPDFAVNLPAATGTGAGGAIGMTLGSLSGAVNINLRLSAMEEIGHVRSIAAPKITTLDNVEAKITQGVEIPYPQSSAQGNTVIMKQAVLSLSVTPHVTNDNMVQMKIEVTKDEPDVTNRGADGSLGISKKSAKTELLVRSGDTAVIGGIYKRQSSLIYRKVPWFADIPIIGWMFKNQYKKDSRSELLIFITPRVLNRSGIITRE